MRVDAFDFHLPDELIATHPATPRESARLMKVSAGGIVSDHTIIALPNLLRPNDLLVFNNTKVIPARLFATTPSGATVEILLHQRVNKPGEEQWHCFAKPAKKIAENTLLTFKDGLTATPLSRHADGTILLQFNQSGAMFHHSLMTQGDMPLPPYIMKKRGEKHSEEQDKADYQTSFADVEGSVAAPTAGLHFTPGLLASLNAKGINHCFLTLHVGAGTFLPVKTEDTRHHIMHSEQYEISEETAQKINATRRKGGRIIACGTTSLRTLESVADDNGSIHAGSGETRLFITPGYRFKAVDLLFTNFHTPKSTLFMLVCAFNGQASMKSAYAHAITKQYRFYSYGDACLLERSEASH